MNEEEEHPLSQGDSKQWRKERKRISVADRSQRKKSDLRQRTKREEEERGRQDLSQLLEGRVLSITAQGYEVQTEKGRIFCTLRRSLLQEKKRTKGLVTVGDLVYFQPVGNDEGVIERVAKRYSVLSRADSLEARKEHIIAANIDQVLICGSVGAPPLKPALIDRYIIAAIKGNMTPVIIINKIDLAPKGEIAPFLELYSALGYTVIPLSTVTGKGLDELREVMRNKASVFAGQSGVGKSSLVNAVTGLQLRTGSVVEKTRKGAHTTTKASLIPLETGGFCIDTPGIKSFGLWELTRQEVASFFPEIEQLKSRCRYPNCSHSHEPGCAIIEACEGGQISPIRYDSYLTLLQESHEKSHLRR